MPTSRSELMKAILAICLMCLSLLPAASLQAAANEEVQPQNLLPPSSERGPEREPRISRDAASSIAKQNFPGEVRSIRRDNQNWRIRMDQDGTVSDVLVNTDSGRVSRPNGD